LIDDVSDLQQLEIVLHWVVRDARELFGNKCACSDGWHLPIDANWTALTDFLDESPWGILKEKGYVHWESQNLGATIESTFTALLCGHRLQLSSGYSVRCLKNLY